MVSYRKAVEAIVPDARSRSIHTLLNFSYVVLTYLYNNR